MKLRILLFVTISAAFGAEIRLDPPVVERCNASGEGTVKVVWRAEPDTAPVTVRLGSANGAAMTGDEPAVGSELTGDWVGEGLVFVLVARDGRELARTSALVECRPARSEFWPLSVGNRWLYRLDSRGVTAAHVTIEVSGAERIAGTLYYIVQPGDRRLRADAEGRVWERLNGVDQLLVDPAAVPHQSYSIPLDRFADTVTVTKTEPLARKTSVYARGVGIVYLRADILAGSSGGFSDGLELEAARLDGHVVWEKPALAPRIAIERDRLDVTGHAVTNCAVPCYFAACGFGPGVDPPNTYKPCAQVRAVWPGLDDEASAALEDSAGRAVWRQTFAAGALDREQYVQVPLYERPNEPVAPGRYRLRLVSGDREASVAVRID